MDKLSLNFFGEKVEVKIPETLDSLRRNISEKFLFSPSDTAELIISYAKDLGKKIIETENDFKEFIKNKIFKIDLDVNPNSQIFQKSLIKLKTEKEADKKELETLLNQIEEIKAQRKMKTTEATKKVNEIGEKVKGVEKQKKEIMQKFDSEIRQLKNEINEIKNKAEMEINQLRLKEKELSKNANEMKEKLGIPVEKNEKLRRKKKSSSKKEQEKKKEEKQKQKEKEKKEKEQKEKEKKEKEKIEKKEEEKKTQNDKIKTFLIQDTNNFLNKVTLSFNNFLSKELAQNNIEENKKKLLETLEKWSNTIKTSTEEITNNLSKKYEEYKNAISQEEKEIHWSYICDGCGMAPIKGKRYHCKTCEDFDFCEKCLNEKKVSHGHDFLEISKSVIAPPERKLRAPRFTLDKIIHKGVTCDGCGVFPIVGNRYICSVCPNFDFCENCEKKYGIEHSHPLVQISNPNIKLYSLKCNLKEKFKMDKNTKIEDVVHNGINCDGCKMENIVGPRYKCSVCPNFDYCEKCVKQQMSSHQHPFIKIYHPKMQIALIEAIIDEDCPDYTTQIKNNINKKNYKEIKEKIKVENRNQPVPMEVIKNELTHKYVTCDGCGMYPVKGCRYKCAVCRNFDFFEKCEKKYYKEHSHPMIPINSPDMKLNHLKINLREQFKMNPKEEEEIIHKGITCKGCGEENIKGNRFKCSACENFDFCEKCFEKRGIEHKHPFIKIYHPKMSFHAINKEVRKNDSPKLRAPQPIKNEKEEKPVHKGVVCDGCAAYPIVGVRYKCAVCKDFDFCEKCEEKLTEKHLHPFIKIYNPEMKLSSIKCIVKEDCPIYDINH